MAAGAAWRKYHEAGRAAVVAMGLVHDVHDGLDMTVPGAWGGGSAAWLYQVQTEMIGAGEAEQPATSAWHDTHAQDEVAPAVQQLSQQPACAHACWHAAFACTAQAAHGRQSKPLPAGVL